MVASIAIGYSHCARVVIGFSRLFQSFHSGCEVWWDNLPPRALSVGLIQFHSHPVMNGESPLVTAYTLNTFSHTPGNISIVFH